MVHFTHTMIWLMGVLASHAQHSGRESLSRFCFFFNTSKTIVAPGTMDYAQV